MLLTVQDLQPRQTYGLATSLEIHCASLFKIPKVPESIWSAPFEDKMSQIEWSYGFVKRSLESGVKRDGSCPGIRSDFVAGVLRRCI